MRIYLVRHGESQGNVDKKVHETVADHAIPLSDKGHEQALAAGKFLAKYLVDREIGSTTTAVPFEHSTLGMPRDARAKLDRMTVTGLPYPLRLWNSPYLRTRQTAEGLMKGLGTCEVRLDLDRREHVLLCEQQFGLFDGVPDAELPVRFPEEHAHYKKQEDFEGRFWARFPMGESRFDVATRVHQAFGTFHRDAQKHHIHNIIVVCHGVTMRAFLMMWLHLTPEWFEAEPNPKNCSIRFIEDGEDRGYIYEG